MTRVLIVLLGFTYALSSYAFLESGYSFGAFGGFGFSRMLPTTTDDYRVAWNAGANLEVHFFKYFYLQPEVMYLQKGLQTSSTSSSVITTATLRYDVVEAPILLKGKWGTPDLKLEVFAGPAVAYAIKRSLDVAVTGSDTVSTDQSSTLSSLEYSLHAGAGVDMSFDDDYSLFFSARYILGFKNLSSDATTEIKTRTVVVLAGVRVAL
jgi:hypothetical protein